MEEPVLDRHLEELIQAFFLLSPSRVQGFDGPGGIMVSEVLAFCTLHALPREKWAEFLEWMRLLDVEFLAYCAEKRKNASA